MRLSGRNMIWVTCFLLTFSINGVLAQQSAQPKGDGVTVTAFKDLVYPELARQLRVQGAVVVQVKLDDQGAVTDAVAISGPPILVPSTLINIKNWRFRPNPSRSAVIVYNFIFIEGRCESHGSLFVLEPSNLATIIGCVPATNP